MQQHPNCKTKVQCCDDRPMSSPSSVKFGPRTPEKATVSCHTPLKI